MDKREEDPKKRKSLISTLWVFVLGNVIYADILSLMDATSPIRKIMAGEMNVPGGGLIAGALIMEVMIIMIPLSRLLPFRFLRIANLISGIISVFFITTGGHGDYYLIFAAIECLTIAGINLLSWNKFIPIKQ